MPKKNVVPYPKSSAKRSGNQRFAGPYSAPGQRPSFTTSLVDCGGKGTATYGIAGVGTQGRGTGTTGYGTGGLGQKGSVQINVTGQEGEFGGGMDKEAIRRVIREHLREIREWLDKRPRSVLEFVPPSPRKSRKQPR